MINDISIIIFNEHFPRVSARLTDAQIRTSINKLISSVLFEKRHDFPKIMREFIEDSYAYWILNDRSINLERPRSYYRKNPFPERIFGKDFGFIFECLSLSFQENVTEEGNSQVEELFLKIIDCLVLLEVEGTKIDELIGKYF